MARILVVEDEPRYRAQLDRILSRAEHDVLAAEDGAAALELGTLRMVDLLVADWMLPGPHTGLDVLRMLRGHWPDVRALIISGYQSEGLLAKCHAIGQTRFLAKPFDVEQFTCAIDALVSEVPEMES